MGREGEIRWSPLLVAIAIEGLYLSDHDDENIVRLTQNESFDAEVTCAADGQKILFGRRPGHEL